MSTTATATLTSGTAPNPQGGSGSAPPANGTGLPANTSGWWDSVKDSGTKEWLGTKKFPDADSALTSYRNLEQLFGADKAGRTVVLPKDDNDADGWAALSKRLGVPESADGYKLPVPEGGDDGFAKTAAAWFQKNGVHPRAATGIANEWNAWVKEQVEAGEAADRAESVKQMEALGKEWGTSFDANRELAQRGYREFASRFGLDDKATLERAESVFGAANLTKFFHGLGSLNSEGGFAGTDGRGGFNTSVADAQKEITQIQADRIAGKISDVAWRKTYGPRMMELGKIVARTMGT